LFQKSFCYFFCRKSKEENSYKRKFMGITRHIKGEFFAKNSPLIWRNKFKSVDILQWFSLAFFAKKATKKLLELGFMCFFVLLFLLL